LVHSVPLFIKQFFGIAEDMITHKNVYLAMTDPTTCILYDFFVIVSLSILFFLSKKVSKKQSIRNQGYLTILKGKGFSGRWSFLFRILLLFLMFLPCVAVLFSPQPSVYLEFAYFYSNRTIASQEALSYHSIMLYVLYLSIFATMLYYFISKNKHNYNCYLAIFFITWINGKRTLMLFCLVGILAVDLLKGKFSTQRKKQIIKLVCFALVILLYFLLYNRITEKGSNRSFYYLYSTYFSRMCITQTAIYDRLYSTQMLEYPGQTVIRNLLVWVPREIWPSKPILYTKYFTKYADSLSHYASYNLMVDMWSEFISNFGMLGPLLSGGALFIVAKQCEKTKSRLVYLVGVCFAVLYSVYGFENIVMILFFAWLGLIFLSKVGKVIFRDQARKFQSSAANKHQEEI